MKDTIHHDPMEDHRTHSVAVEFDGVLIRAFIDDYEDSHIRALCRECLGNSAQCGCPECVCFRCMDVYENRRGHTFERCDDFPHCAGVEAESVFWQIGSASGSARPHYYMHRRCAWEGIYHRLGRLPGEVVSMEIELQSILLAQKRSNFLHDMERGGSDGS